MRPLREKWQKTLRPIYLFKWNIDTGTRQVGWFTGKLPEVMSIVYLLKEYGVYVPPDWLIPLGCIGILTLAGIGAVWKRVGLFDVERHVDTLKDPIANEIYKAAKHYNKKNKVS